MTDPHLIAARALLELREELKDQITEGIEVDYIVALGNMKIMRTK